MQYVETFLIKFDLDGDQNLSPLETQLFLDKHILPIAKLVGYDPDQFSDVIRAYFTYLIKFHRSLLDEEDLGRDLRFGYWKEAQPFWEFHGSRFDLSFVLVNL